MQFPALEIDHDITDWVVAHRVGWLDTVFHIITTAGNTLSMTVIALAAAVICVAARLRPQAWLIVIGSASGYLVMIALKQLFARDRPPVRDRLVDIDTFAFPSGHAMMSGIVLGLIGVAALQTSTWIRTHRAVLLIAPVLSLVIGASRVYLGVHWASDVVGGWLFAVVWIVVAAAAATLAQTLLGRPVAATAGTALDQEDRRPEQPDRQPDKATDQGRGRADSGDPDDDGGHEPERHPDVDHHLG